MGGRLEGEHVEPDGLAAGDHAGDLLDVGRRLPVPATHPSGTYRRLVRGRTERVPVSKMADRVAAVMVVPYPPGIPILMPGESAGGARRAGAQLLARLGGLRHQVPRFRP
ncbi:MAG: hypothetical protein ACLQNG_02285 [Acidimicrobiales bacterium]